MRGEQLARQWVLIQRLARSRGGVGLDELAEELECVRRTVYRDLDALMLAGFPLLSERRDGRVYYRFLDTFRLGDVPFTADEMLALAFGEDLLRTLEGTVFHDSIRSALDKIRASLGPDVERYLARLDQSFRVLPGPHKSYARFRETIQRLNQAVLERLTVRVRYRTARTGEDSVRKLDPYHVWYQAGALYVVGHDHRRGEIRTFAVHRIRRIELTQQRFEVPGDFDFDAYKASSFGVVAEPAERVRIRFHERRAEFVAERTWHPSQRLERRPDGSLELVMEVGTGEETRQWVLGFGADAEVLEPESLRADVRRELARALVRYERAPRARVTRPARPR